MCGQCIIASIYCSILDRKDSCRVSVTPCLLSPFIYHHFSFSRHHHYIRFYYIENVGEKSSWELVPFTYILQLCIERLSSYLLASNSLESFSESLLVYMPSVFKIRTPNQLQVSNVLLCSKILSNTAKSIQIFWWIILE